MEIRSATDRDLKGILEIYNHSILNTTSVYSYEPWTYEMMEEWFNTKVKVGYPVLVSVENLDVCGFASFGSFRNWPAYENSVEHSVHIHPHFRRKGIASKLISLLIEDAKSKGKHVFIGGVDSKNEGSILLHQKLGFEKVAHFKQVGHKFNEWLDLLFFQITLEP